MLKDVQQIDDRKPRIFVAVGSDDLELLKEEIESRYGDSYNVVVGASAIDISPRIGSASGW